MNIIDKLRCEKIPSVEGIQQEIDDWEQIMLEAANLIETLLTEGKVMRAALEDIHQHEGTSYAHARTVAHQGLSGEYSAQVGQSSDGDRQ